MRENRSISSLLIVATVACSNMAWANNFNNAAPLPIPPTSYEPRIMSDTENNLNIAMVGSASSPKKSPQNNDDSSKILEKYLQEGRLVDGESALSAALQKAASDDNTRFSLGIIQFLRAVECLCQDLYHYGLRDMKAFGLNLPILHLPVGENPNPATFAYEDARDMMDRFRQNLLKSEATLAEIKDANVKVPVLFGLVRMDLNGDGKADESETLWKVYAHISRGRGISKTEQPTPFPIHFDRGDVHWRRGYCHLLSTICEVYLAYDSRESFECGAHIFFKKVKTPYKFLTEGKHVHRFREDMDLADIIAMIHLIRWQVVEPKRMEEALHHLEAVIAQSKESWKWIMFETDDDYEWLPNPRQTGVMPGMKVTDEMVKSWLEMMSEIELILQGKVLTPFWRGEPGGRGINVRKVFLQPGPLDIVMWIQGPAAAPYLERGTITKSDVWNNLRTVFGSDFPGFAIWFN